MSLAEWGNKLHTGERTYPIVQKRRMWIAISVVLMALCVLVLLVRGLNFGVDFTGGTVFQVSKTSNPDPAIATQVIDELAPDHEAEPRVIGQDGVWVEIGVVELETANAIEEALAEAFGVSTDNISSSQIGPTFGSEVGKKAIQSLIVFLLLVSIVMTLYFRAWRMALASIIALLHDLVFTVGIYALVGFEVTPASVIGFLTILGYSLYDTVVVFDKVRENTANLTSQHRFTYLELANLALNQTLVRSINTTVVALLPVGAILFVGTMLLGAGTLEDLALALFVGMAVGAYSSLFLATPLEVTFRGREERIVTHTNEVLEMRASGKSDVVVDDAGHVRVGALQPGTHLGTAAQPKRKRRK